ncbi:MAG: response regulator transcription factor [Tractidigestivibacter sp.]|jgi:DNA-binding CsgD family transcriptional regulator|uniref:response regulator transcription factor n=1 Tax=Tractidigestivibacter sp. TaxID=2847320 RepID=UPI003D8C2202
MQTALPWEKISDCLLACGEVRNPYRFSVKVLEEMHSLVRFDGGVVLMLDGNRNVVRSYFSNIPKKMSKLYLDYFSHDSGAAPFSLDMDVRESRAVPTVNLISWKDFSEKSGTFFTDYIKPLGLKQTMSFWLCDLYGNPATIFSLDRTSGSPYTVTELRTVEVTTMHLNNLYKNLFVRPEGQVRIWDGMRGAETLSPREKEVLDLLCQGVKPSNIARILCISQGTTNKHISHIYQKLGVGSRQELLVRMLGK